MRVLLVGPDLEENLSLRYLSSSLSAAGHKPKIATFDTAADTDAVLAVARDVDMVGLSLCYQIRAPEFLALARALKRAKPGLCVIAGGHFASCAAGELLSRHPEIDLIAVHECERTIAELASLSDFGETSLAAVPGLAYRAQDRIATTKPREALADLDSLAWPDRSGPARLMAGVPTAYMMGSRGCLSNCDYCCISTMHRMVSGKRFRQRSPENIVAEMTWLYRERGIRQFIFHDDNFLVPQVERNLERIDALDKAMRRHRLRRVALALKCRPADVNREVFLRLREMGLLRVFLGIESGSKAGLASIGRRQTVEDEHRALRICEELGISTQYTIIMFHPEASLQSMREDLAFVAEHPGHPLSFCRAEIYSGTPLEQRMLGESRAYGNYLAREYDYTDPVTALTWTVARDLLAERCWAQDCLLGQIIRLDHQATVLQHFYEGGEVDRLATEFADFELEVNRDTICLMQDLFDVCEAHPRADSTALKSSIADLRERERSRCQFFIRRACAFREAIREQSLDAMGLARTAQTASATGTLLESLPRHAAAVFLAVGLLNCNGKSALPTTRDGSFTDSAADSKSVADTTAYKDQGGMFEAPPPPMDAPIVPDASVPDGVSFDNGIDAGAGAIDGGAKDATAVADAFAFKDQGGMFEAPPPPADAFMFRDQGGMFEAPPPPADASLVRRDSSKD
jgi:anaerobic magnesium-protoporphyrin IX monomethyl ester cyclase